MKVFIHTDLEGISDFYDWKESTIGTSRGIGYTKEYLTKEVNAAIEGILSVDNDAEIVVEDGHGGGYHGPNFIAENLHQRAKLLVGKFSRHLATIDDTFELLMMIGMHAKAGTQCGLMNHTLSRDRYFDMRLNGVSIGEIGLCASIAGYYGVPLAMVSGDHWAVQEAMALTGDIEGAAVKKGLSTFHAECLHPVLACNLIREAARRAIARKSEFKPYYVKSSIELEVDYLYTEDADEAERKKGAHRQGGRSVLFTGDDLLYVLSQSL